MVLIYVLQKLFNVSLSNLYFILVLNPLIIYSIGILGQLDFIPLTFFMISLYYLKDKNKYYSIFFYQTLTILPLFEDVIKASISPCTSNASLPET